MLRSPNIYLCGELTDEASQSMDAPFELTDAIFGHILFTQKQQKTKYLPNFL